jgi:hypothetical protein
MDPDATVGEGRTKAELCLSRTVDECPSWIDKEDYMYSRKARFSTFKEHKSKGTFFVGL